MKKAILMKAVAGMLASVMFFGGVTENASVTAMAAEAVCVGTETVSGNSEGEAEVETKEAETEEIDVVDEDNHDVEVFDAQVNPVKASSNWDDFTRDKDDESIITGLSKDGKKKTEVIIPAGATKIAKKAFSGKTQVLRKVTFASGSKLTTIGEGAFEDIDTLTTIELPNSLTMIGKDAFCNTGLTAVTIPANVTTIGDGAFENTYKLAEFNFAANSKLTVIPSKMIYCSFGNNEITDITIPSSVTEIGEKAFYGIKNLRGITIPAKVTKIHAGAFASSGLKTVSVNATGLNECDEGIFMSCSINRVSFSNNMPAIPANLFCNAGFEDATIEIPASVTVVKEAAFKQDYAENGSGIQKIIFLGNKVTSIEKEAFYGNSITSVGLPSSLLTIGDSAFEECQKLTKVALPEGVKSIGAHAFKNCKSLYTVYLPMTLKTVTVKKVKENNKDVYELPFEGCPNGLKFYVVKNSYAESWARSCKNYKDTDKRSFAKNGFDYIVAYSIKYKLGSNAANDVENPTSYVDNETLILNNPVRHGYNFAYWSKGKTVYNPENGKTSIPCTTGTITLKANWIIADDYTIDYDLDGGVLTKTPKYSYNIGKTVTLKKPKKEGYTFVGWYVNGSKVTKLKKGTYYGGNITLKAKWSPATYVITFDGNGATSGEMSDLNCTYGKSINLPANKFKKEGYEFTGWKYKIYKTKEYRYEIDEANVLNIRPKGTVKFIAQWDKVQQ